MTEKGKEDENWTRAREARGRAPFPPFSAASASLRTYVQVLLRWCLPKGTQLQSAKEVLSFLALDAQANLQTVDLSEINADIVVGFFFF